MKQPNPEAPTGYDSCSMSTFSAREGCSAPVRSVADSCSGECAACQRVPAYEGVVMDEGNHKPPSAVGFRVAMVVLCLLLAIVLWYGFTALAHLLEPVWDRQFNR